MDDELLDELESAGWSPEEIEDEYGDVLDEETVPSERVVTDHWDEEE